MGGMVASGRTETAVDESRKETADRVARYQIDYVGRACLFYSCHKLLRLSRRFFGWTSVFLPFPLALGRIIFMLLYSYCFDLFVTSPGGHGTSFLLSILFYFFNLSFFCFFVPFVFLSVNASVLQPFVCKCRIQYDGMPLHGLLCSLHYNVVSHKILYVEISYPYPELWGLISRHRIPPKYFSISNTIINS